MSASGQTVIALVVVALAAGGLVWRALATRGKHGCGGGECGAVSPDARAFLKKVRKR
jgi:hypothetical protein